MNFNSIILKSVTLVYLTHTRGGTLFLNQKLCITNPQGAIDLWEQKEFFTFILCSFPSCSSTLTLMQ